MRLYILPLLLISFTGFAQYKNYKLTSKGDTINIVDRNDLRQGRWAVKVDGVRGEPGYEEEGVYKDGKKEGVWRLFTTMADLIAVERYRWGNKDGKNQYFNIRGLLREESWKAVNPDNPYDTIDVPDLMDPNKVTRKVIKIEGTAIKHGDWKYFDGATGSLVKKDTYFLDKLEDPMAKLMAAEKAAADTTNGKTTKAPAKPKPKEVLDFEKKIGKKKIKVIDGRTYN
jgi:hypothetical protein